MRRRVPPVVLPAPLVALAAAGVVLIAGCGESGGEQDADSGAAQQVGTVRTVDCPAGARPVALPRGFSAPLPRGTVVVDVRQESERRTVVTGVVPAAEKDVLADLQHSYPAAGLTLTEGETEARDAESNFTGSGLKGRWGIRELANCSPVATRVDVVVAPG